MNGSIFSSLILENFKPFRARVPHKVILMGKDHSKSQGRAEEQKAKKEADAKAKNEMKHKIGRKGKN